MDAGDLFSIICSNIRVADQRIGDVQGAGRRALDLVGEERLGALMDRYGDDTVVEAAIDELRRPRGAADARGCIGEIPDGGVRLPLRGSTAMALWMSRWR